MVTPGELVGRTFLLLCSVPEIKKKIQLLVDSLSKKDLVKLSQAANKVLDSLAGTDGFRLGAVVCTEGKSMNGVHFEDPLIPIEFVKELNQVLETAKSQGSSAAN
jgi:hypothetical protein